MSAANDTGLMQTCFKGWNDIYQEQKKANELQDMLNSNNSKFSEFSNRNKASAGNCMDRAAYLQELNYYTMFFLYWKKETKVARMRQYAKEKNNKKRQQLIGVKGLFRNFANEL